MVSSFVLTGDSKPEVLVWTKAFIALVEALRMYVKQWHLTGMTWDPKVSGRLENMERSAQPHLRVSQPHPLCLREQSQRQPLLLPHLLRLEVHRPHHHHLQQTMLRLQLREQLLQLQAKPLSWPT